MRKQTAPSNVPPLDHLEFNSSLVSGTTYAPIAERPKKIDPSMFTALIAHDLSRA
jgi:hypothetical protein